MEPQEFATNREGTGRLRPGPSSSQRPGLVLQGGFPGLNPQLVRGYPGADPFLPDPQPWAQPQAGSKEEPKAQDCGHTSTFSAPSRPGTWGQGVKEHLVPALKGP